MKEKLLKKENMIVFALVGILLLVIAIPIDTGSDVQAMRKISRMLIMLPLIWGRLMR